MYYDSILIKKLTSIEISDLKEELEVNNNLWTQHFPDLSLTALKEGKSIHLQWCDKQLVVTRTLWDLFPKTKQLLQSILGENTLGRVYWHRLLPGETINPHTDCNLEFVKNGQLQHRYQIYLDIDNDIEIFFADRLIDGSQISNSIIDFPLKSMHHYNNKSNSTLYLLVFDDIGTPSRIRTSECRNQNPMP
jgi:hypothetical protein